MMKNKGFFKTAYGIIVMALLLVAAALVSIRFGSSRMSFSEFIGGLLRSENFKTQSLILYTVRLPRVIGAILAGVGLSVSGVLLQNVTGNGLAGPNIIGVNAGAGFVTILLMFFLPAAVYVFPLGAFVGAFLTTVIIVSVASKINNSKSTVILAGIAITAVLNAGISFVSLIEPDILASYNNFSIGGLSGVKSDYLVLPCIIILVCVATSLFLSRRIDTLCLGDNVANSLGVNVKALRVICLMISSACAAAVVSFAGLLGFVGLVVPHIARKLVGFKSVFLIIYAALIGGILVLVADLLGRILFAPSELPVGIVMSFIGAPFFFWLLIKRRNYADI